MPERQFNRDGVYHDVIPDAHKLCNSKPAKSLDCRLSEQLVVGHV